MTKSCVLKLNLKYSNTSVMFKNFHNSLNGLGLVTRVSVLFSSQQPHTHIHISFITQSDRTHLHKITNTRKNTNKSTRVKTGIKQLIFNNNLRTTYGK